MKREYWKVNGLEGVFSRTLMAFVSDSNEDYQSWLSTPYFDNVTYRPQVVASEDKLWDELLKDSFEPSGLAASVDRMKARVKREANKRIVSILPEWKQRNYIARQVELIGEQAVRGRSLTAKEQDELGVIENTWDNIKAIRAASDAKEAEIDALATDDERRAYDYAAGWP